MKSSAGKGILITVSQTLPDIIFDSMSQLALFSQGKGYPDLSTRAFVRRLLDTTQCLDSGSDSYQKPQFFALVDCDPDGMAIMSIYKYGSTAQSHENPRLNAPRVQWLGLRTTDMVVEADPHGDDSLIPLTARDRKKALNMLKNNPAFAENGPQVDWRVELQQTLILNLKAELEVLYGRDGGIEGWLDQKMKY
jgi:meiotic recombination protein SPO11